MPFEGPAALEPRLRRAGFRLATTRFFEDTELPGPAAADLLVVMGGPMSVHDETAFPWLAAEKDFIRRFVATGRPVLGVCLGAQLLACALGTRVYPGPEKEIGWLPVTGEPHRNPAVFRFPQAAEVFQWHGETFDLPPGAVRLARSRVCENQAFQIGAAIGLQFHLEATPESVRILAANARNELVSGRFIQTEAEILAATAEKYAALHRLLDALLAHLLSPLALRLS